MDENQFDSATPPPRTPRPTAPLGSPAGNPSPPPPPPRKSRKFLWLGILVAVIVAVVLIAVRPWSTNRPAGRHGGPPGAAAGGGRHGGAAAANQTQAVRVAKAVIGEIPIVQSALGTVTPLATVTVRTQIAGSLMQIGFKEGQHVRKGDFLAQVDPRPYEIQLRQAQGTLRKDQALLNQAKLDLQRYKTLLSQDSVARQTFDNQVSLVEQYAGTVTSDQANIDTYKLDLVYARITAPVDGRVGLRQVDVGNYVQTGDTNGIVVITQLQPMSVIFTLPEDSLRAVMARVGTGASLSASAYDRTNTTQIALGALDTVDNQIDTSTGTIKLRALFQNKDETLFPNQFVNVRLLVDVMRNAVIVPSAAIQTGSIGSYVYVAKADNTVTVRKIVVGPVDGERTAVTSGLQTGESVVIDGVDRLREGAKISIPGSPASGAVPASAASGTAGAGRSLTTAAVPASGGSGAAGAHRHQRRHTEAQ